MLRLIADENFNRSIVSALLGRRPDIDIVRVQDVGLLRADDQQILHWAAQHGRIVLTHDVTTMTGFAYQRVHSGQSMVGLFAVQQTAPISEVIGDLLILIECSIEGEWEN